MLSAIQRLAARFSRGFVLAFHDILPERVSELVDSIGPARAVPLSELVDRSKRRRPTSGLFAITVDDGVGETVRNLSRLFQARQWPATFYLATGYIESQRGMSFQLWRAIMPHLPLRKLELTGGAVDLSAPGALEKLSRKMERLWHSQRLEAYHPLTLELMNVALRESGSPLESLRVPEPITWPEVTDLSRGDLIRFESHGVSHTAMSSLTDDELISEMHQSRDVISMHSGRECRHLAYPFGNDLSIGERAVSMAGRFYDSAVTMTLGHVDAANPWLLPRIPLYPTTSPWFARAKILAKCTGRGFTQLPGRESASRPRAESQSASMAGRSRF